jgi:PPK2 family polyphosphate:nucleotide phosphotransferase
VSHARKLDAPHPVHLAEYDPDDTDGLTRLEAEAQLATLHERLRVLQDLLFGAGRHSVLLVLQGMDTSGKDGVIRDVMSQLTPTACRVANFKVPTEEELRHDFLWRIHQQTPARGTVTIFNRSHYEDVLAARVHQLVPADEWQDRYAEINHFEHLLACSGTLVLKCFLHISKEEQRKRLLAREHDPDKAWKLSVDDWKDRAYWDAYQTAYEEALSRCATAWAPWYVVAANHKWSRDVAVARILVDTLGSHEGAWRHDVEQRGRAALAALLEARRMGTDVE